jgi:hypothetical protein
MPQSLHAFRTALFTPEAFFPTASLAQSFRVCSHSLGLIDIPEAPGFTDNIRGRRMQNRSSEYFPEENGLPACADLNWPLGKGLKVGIWLRKTHAAMEMNGHMLHWSIFLTSSLKFSSVVCMSLFSHLFIKSFFENSSFVKWYANYHYHMIGEIMEDITLITIC